MSSSAALCLLVCLVMLGLLSESNPKSSLSRVHHHHASPHNNASHIPHGMKWKPHHKTPRPANARHIPHARNPHHKTPRPANSPHIPHDLNPHHKTPPPVFFVLELSKKDLLLIIVVSVSSVLIVGIAISLTLCCYYRRKNKVDDTVLFKGCEDTFDLEYLLNAPAELLGEGTFGSTYKVDLDDGTSIALKRIKGSWRRKSGFEAHMETVRGIKHANIVGLKAFYCSENETFLVYDYFDESLSVSSLLHGNNGQNRIHLDWKTRMLVAIGAAKGIARIHQENEGSMVHGNIRTSNIFLNSHRHGSISEPGIGAVVSPLSPPTILETGYRAPEITHTRMSTQLADVYSFGVVLLELLTGKPAVTRTGNGNSSLAQWIQVAQAEEWTTDLLDTTMLRTVNVEAQLIKLLKLAILCVDTVPNKRIKMSDLVPLMEVILHDAE